MVDESGPPALALDGGVPSRSLYLWAIKQLFFIKSSYNRHTLVMNTSYI